MLCFLYISKKCSIWLIILNYGFDNLAIKIIIDYFNGRSQVVKIDDILSNLADLLLAIAQGSCLGPLFFFIYINDLPR